MIPEDANEYTKDTNYIQCFAINKSQDSLYLPLGLWKKYFTEFPNGSKDDYPKLSSRTFKRKLLTKQTDPKVISGERPVSQGRDQDVVVRRALEELKNKRSTFLACYTGFGKTTLGLYLTCSLGLKTVILIYVDTVKREWPDSIVKFTNLKCQMVTNEKVLDPEADIYVIGIKKASNMDRKQFENIGTVIIDEAHIATVLTFSKVMYKFKPQYLIALTATPDRRSDGMHKLYKPFFGEMDDYIIRREKKNFTVIRYQTKYKPNIEYNSFYGKSRLDWNEMERSLAENEERQDEIVDLAIKYINQHKIMIASFLQSLSKALYQKILDRTNGNAALLISNIKEWNRSKRILVAGRKKAGVGMNDPELTMLILTSSMKDVRQLEGRIRTDNNLIIDIVDNHNIYKNHFKIREKWYLEKGGTIIEDGWKGEKKEPYKRYLK